MVISGIHRAVNLFISECRGTKEEDAWSRGRHHHPHPLQRRVQCRAAGDGAGRRGSQVRYRRQDLRGSGTTRSFLRGHIRPQHQ